MSTLPVSCVIVVHNQALLLERAIKSVRYILDDIVVVHDGPCDDQSVNIAKKYGCRVFVRKHFGHSEKNRSFSYRKAKNRWVIQLDADEYVSMSHELLLDMIKSDVIGAYGFRWEFQINNKSVFMGHKTALFNLDRVYFIGSIHQIASVKVGFKHKNTNNVLFHKTNYKHSSFKDMRNKLSKWAIVHATEYTMPVQTFDNWFYNSDKWPLSTQLRIDHPFLFGYIFTPIYVCVTSLLNALISKSTIPFGYGFNYVYYWLLVTTYFIKINKGRAIYDNTKAKL